LNRRALLAALAAAPLLVGGCAAPQSAALRRGGTVGSAGGAARVALPRTAKILAVPFHPQREWECGPAALAMAMGHAGTAIEPEALVPEVWLPARRGSLQAEMLAAPPRRGLLSVRLESRLGAPLAAVADGLPAIVFQNLGLAFSPVWHYAVLIGYDLERERVVLHTGVDEASEQSINVFERTWVRAGSWAMTVSRPDRLPAGASEDAITRGAAALERAAPAAALRTWMAILERWPENRTAALGLGNAAWSSGDRERARRAWQQAADRHPDFADAWNNLAHVLAEGGDLPAARKAAARAVELGGARVDAYRETLQRLSQ